MSYKNKISLYEINKIDIHNLIRTDHKKGKGGTQMTEMEKERHKVT